MVKISEQQHHILEIRKDEIKFYLSKSDLDWDYIIELATEAKGILERFPAKDGEELKDPSEWHDPSVYREGFTKEEYSEWLKLSTCSAMFNMLRGNCNGK